ncbi:hypothetical protein D3C71_1832230 [compost metagenome]
MNLIDIARGNFRLNRQFALIRCQKHQWIARIGDTANGVDHQLVNPPAHRSFQVEPLELIQIGHFSFFHLRNSCLDFGQLFGIFRSAVFVEL